VADQLDALNKTVKMKAEMARNFIITSLVNANVSPLEAFDLLWGFQTQKPRVMFSLWHTGLLLAIRNEAEIC
jgi:hypothetical protein